MSVGADWNSNRASQTEVGQLDGVRVGVNEQILGD